MAGQPLAARGARMLSDGGTAPVLVVTGAAQVRIPGVSIVVNPQWRSGMGSSLRAGLAAVPDDAEAVVIALADQPLIGPESVRRLIAAFADGAMIAVASYAGQQRNPVLIARPYWAQAAAAAVGDTGARPFLRANAALVTAVECGDTGRPDDLDTPEDLRRIGELMSAQHMGER